MIHGAQGTFDKIVRHLRRQKAQALNGGSCVYLATDNKRCAAGGLIPRASYSKKFEGARVLVFSDFRRQVSPKALKEASSKLDFKFDADAAALLVSAKLYSLGYDLDVCRRMQSVHDNHSPQSWESAFKSAAAELNVKIPAKRSRKAKGVAA